MYDDTPSSFLVKFKCARFQHCKYMYKLNESSCSGITSTGHSGINSTTTTILLPHQQQQKHHLLPHQQQQQQQQKQLPKLNLNHLQKKQKTNPNLPTDYNPYHMESYFGFVPSSQDAALLLSAMETPGSLVKPIQRRLLAAERFAIRSGSCFVFSERESGMKRWYVPVARRD